MLIRLRKLKDDQDGQSIVLAALGMLVLAVGVMATVNLGHAVNERIKLQNNADAAAYSLAALEARAFNFFAFTNRAQASHYVTAMSLQSYLAILWFAELLLGTLADLVSWVVVISCGCSFIPYIGAICKIVNSIAKPVYKVMRKLHKYFKKFADKVDKILGKVVYYLPRVNRYGVYTTQVLMKGLALANAADSGNTVARENDPDINPSFWNAVTAGLNIWELERIFDEDSGWGDLPAKNPNAGQKGAQRVMTEISNATRYPDFITNRSIDNILSSIPGIGRLLRYIPISIGPTGQTKMTTHIRKCGWNTNCRCSGKSRFSTAMDWSGFSRGSTLTADEIMKIELKIIKWKFKCPLPQDYASVWAHPDDGEHCSHDNRCFDTWICGEWCNPKPKCWGDSDNHRWDGIEPYMKFKPNSDPQTDFHQPSVFSALNKPPDALGSKAFDQHFTLTVGSRSEEINTEIGDKDNLLPVFPKGLNAFSRAMAYYHRPSFRDGTSNWREHPNFFNPFWRPKLAPIGDKITKLVGGGSGGGIIEAITKELITH